MERLILSEQGYREQMENVVKPYLDIRKSVLWPEREEGKKIYCERYLADSPKGVVMISHGFTETAEKYKEVIYYFVKKTVSCVSARVLRAWKKLSADTG